MEKKITFEEIFSLLEKFWLEQGCVIWQPHHEMVGAGTANPATLMRVLGPEPWNVAYVEPSFRPDDGRYAENPNRMQMHHQYQVILKPIPENVQELYLESLKLIGLSPTEHDIRFVEDNWESPALGAWGLGWEVWSDGMEITQFTYFQQAGGIILDPPACEITYGLERIAMYLQDVNSVWDLAWNNKIQYGDLLKSQEVDFCVYNFEVADIEKLRAVYQFYEEEAQRCIDKKLIAPTYDYGVKCSHTFNILDARGAISVAERVHTFKRIRDIVRDCASLYVERREELGFPNMKFFPAWQAAETGEKIPEPAAAESFVLEIGMEELPSSEAEGMHQSFSDLIVKTLDELRIEYKSIQFLATPRRLAVLVEEMAPKQKNIVQTVRGPRRDIIESNPKALQGFLRKNQITEEDIEYQQINGGEFATAEKKIEGLFSTQVLAEQIPQILSKLNPRKPMRWLASEHVGEEIAKTSFSRPIRWFVCLYGADVVPFNYAGIQSGRTTRGGRFDESPSIEISNAAEYKSVMEQHAIALDRTKRREHIAKQIEAIAASHNGSVDQNDALLDEVTDLVECPTVFLGGFSEDFLCLPEEVLKLVAEKYQRYFLLRGANGRISNHFIGVRNGGRENLQIVQDGNERVFRARLTDAAFFYNKDQEDSLEVYLKNTAKLTYHEKIGSMREKAERVHQLALMLTKNPFNLTCDLPVLDRAAYLAKADLSTRLVTEMTALQGTAGKFYALAAGEPEAVAHAIEEHYSPRSAKDSFPQSPEGLIISIADRLDNLAALFAAKAKVTSTSDPYGLRRDAYGVVGSLLNLNESFSLRRGIDAAAEILPIELTAEKREEVYTFIVRRFENLLEERGYAKDAIDAVLSIPDVDPAPAVDILDYIQKNRESAVFLDAAEVYNRCERIIRKSLEAEDLDGAVKENLFQHDQEKQLWQTIQKGLEQIAQIDPASDRFEKGIVLIADMKELVADFFDHVTVMDENLDFRQNRFALLNHIVSMLRQWGDLRYLEIS